MDRSPHCALILLLPAVLAAQDAEGLWLGTLSPEGGGLQLRMALAITRHAAGALSGKLDSIDQGLMGAPLANLAQQGREVRFEMKVFGARYSGELAADGSRISGEWKQSWGAVPVVFQRVERFRPQDPVKPYPYISEEVAFENRKAGVRFAGTLTRPPTTQRPPAVLLISGSGPEDRDGATAGHRPFLVLADYLTRRGIAVLRVDDRGVGGSTGKKNDAALADLAGDALAAVEFLKTRREIDPARIGLIGHSEGGLVAPLAAAGSADIAFLVLLAAPGVAGEKLLRAQAYALAQAMGVPDEIAARNRDLQQAVFDILRQEPDNAAARKKIRARAKRMKAGLEKGQQQAFSALFARLEAELDTMTSPAFRAFLAYDPVPTLRKLRVPVLAIDGDRDLLVPPDPNLAAIAQALDAARNPGRKTVKLAGLNHLLQTAATGSPMEYAKLDETMSPAALELIAGWVESQR